VRFRNALLTLLLFPLPLALTGTSGQASPAPNSSESGWEYVRSPNVGPEPNYLRSVEAVSSDDVWAVGDFGPSDHFRTLTEHWDGSRWRVIQSPSPGVVAQLLGVATISSDDVWAVGSFCCGRLGYQTLTLHWDGTAWAVVPTPTVYDALDSYLTAVAAVSSNDVWAVGYLGNSGFEDESLTMHWDGTQWSVVTGHLGGLGDHLYAVSASSSYDVWAAGSYYDYDSPSHALIAHWDGESWSDFSPPEDPESSVMYDVSSMPGGGAWALGMRGEDYLLWRWDGATWRSARAPIPGGGWLSAVAGVSPSEAWSVGACDCGLEEWATLTLRFDAGHWRLAPGPSVGNLTGITIVSRGDLWAVGHAFPGDLNARTLTVHFSR
jgi:hypothetical protein